MKTRLTIFALFIFSFIFTSCSSIPDWFTNPPQSENYLYASKTAVSKEMQFAIEKATMEARAELARQLETKIVELQKRFIEETGNPEDNELGKHFAIATKSVVNTSINGSRVVKKKFFKEDKHWRAYVLVELPWGKAREEFLRNINKDSVLLEKVRNTPLYKELDSETK